MKKFFCLLIAFLFPLLGYAEPVITETIVVDLMTKISRRNVERAVQAVQELTLRDLAPHWGVATNITLLPRGQFPKLKSNNVIVEYLVDEVQHPELFMGTIAANYIVQPDDNPAGPQPSFWIPDAPKVPVGTAVDILPFGSVKQFYGIAAMISLGAPTFPNLTRGDALSITMSHEIMEILVDRVFGFFFFPGSYQVLDIGANKTKGFSRQICDPVGFGGFNFYKIKGTKVQNFVLPAFFNPWAEKKAQLDFLGNVQKPLTPFGGNIFGFAVNSNGRFAQTIHASFPPDVENILEITFTIYPACQSKEAEPEIPFRMKGYRLPMIQSD